MQRPSLSTTYFDPEVTEVPEQQQEQPIEKPKRRGRPLGSKNSKPKGVKRSIPWFNIWRSVFWSAVSCASVLSLYIGVGDTIGAGVADISLAVVLPTVAFLLDRDLRKMWGNRG